MPSEQTLQTKSGESESSENMQTVSAESSLTSIAKILSNDVDKVRVHH